jgi:hypothetical protein
MDPMAAARVITSDGKALGQAEELVLKNSEHIQIIGDQVKDHVAAVILNAVSMGSLAS